MPFLISAKLIKPTYGNSLALVVEKKGAEAAAVALAPEKGILRFGVPGNPSFQQPLLHKLGA